MYQLPKSFTFVAAIFPMQHELTPPTGSRQFPCHSCGAFLVYKPDTPHLVCEYCGTDHAIADAREVVAELDFESFPGSAAGGAEKQQVAVVQCTSCGASSSLKPNVTADHCPFCGTALVVSSGSLCTVLKPKSLLPFRIERKQGFDLFKGWVHSLWFAPNDLKELAENHERLTGLYLPYWTYDCRTETDYTGQRGDDYYVSETYTATEKGRSVTRTRQVRKTRWRQASGHVFNTFDDILVSGSHSLPTEYCQALEPWDLKGLVPFTEQYLSGFRAETYQVDVKAGFEVAKKMMDGAIRSTVCEDIGGDHQQISSLDVQYHHITFKHILLPVWLSAYRYRGKVYRFMVNGRTGEVQGERPWSWIKITLAVLAVIMLTLLIIYFMDSK